MTAKILKARAYHDRLAFVIHLDITKMDPLVPANPDPRWLYSRDWSLPANWTARTAGVKTSILTGIRVELLSDCQQRIADLTEEDAGGTALAIEGQTFG